jgi:hypothetical protein
LISKTTKRFRAALENLPPAVRRHARESYRLFREDPYHPGLGFRQVHPSEPIYSVRIGLHHRALAVRSGEEVVWFWIGSHADYDNLLARL